MCPCCYQQGGSLLHCPSTLTCAEGVFCTGGSFLLHFPWSRLHRTLSGILPCEARTFLTCCLSALTAAMTCLTCLGYYITSYFKIQFLFCNSLIHDQIMPISRRCRQCITSFILRMSIMTFYPDKCNMMRFLCF